MNKLRTIFRLGTLLVILSLLVLPAKAEEGIIGFDSDRWTLYNARIVDYLGQKCLAGSAVLQDADFENGIVEFDIAFEGPRCFAGIMFRMQSLEDYEEFYLRPHKSNQPDALQYTPVFNGLSGWQLYSGPGFTAAAEIPPKRWIHLRVEIQGNRARVFLDNSPNPALEISDLKRGPGGGALGLKGPNTGLAHFANFSISSDVDLDFEAFPVPEHPPGLLRSWEISRPLVLTEIDRERHPDEQNLADLQWQSVVGEDSGLVDVARFVKKEGAELNCILARTTIDVDHPQTKKMTFGYSDQIVLFLNGKILFRGDSRFRLRDPGFQGLVGLFDSVFLPLSAGRNDLLLALTEDFGGWGFICRLDSVGEINISTSPALTKLWESPKSFNIPESVCYDAAREILYVSNYGGSSVSRVRLDGSVADLEWASGLEAPTGMALHETSLYVADRKGLVEIDTSSGKIRTRYEIRGSRFLNDVVCVSSGEIYVSDSQGGIVFRIKDGEAETWIEGEGISNPNGLARAGERLLVGTSGDGSIKAVNLADKTVTSFLKLGPGAVMDGIKPLPGGGCLLSDWSGRILMSDSSGQTTELLNSQAAKINCADFEYIPDLDMIVIPLFYGNRLLAFRLETEMSKE